MLQIVIVLGGFHTIASCVLGEIKRVHGLVTRVGMTEHGHFVGGEGGVADALDFVVEFSVNARTRHANKCTMGQIHALCQLGRTIGTRLIGRKALQSSNDVVQILFHYLAPSARGGGGGSASRLSGFG